MDKKCFLCNNYFYVNHFDNESFRNCFTKLLYRKKKGFKYHDVELSVESGYHSSCYKKVTALKKTHIEDFELFMKNNEVSAFFLFFLFHYRIGFLDSIK